MVNAATSNGTFTAYSVVLALKAGESSASATLSAFRVASEEPDLLMVFVPEEPEELELELDELDELDDGAFIVTDLLVELGYVFEKSLKTTARPEADMATLVLLVIELLARNAIVRTV